MGRKSFIALAALAVTLAAATAAGYAYDASNEDRIAKGVTVAGVDVGGLDTGEARARVKRRVVAPLMRPVTVTHDSRRFSLSPEDAGLRADVGGMVDEALKVSRDGGIVSRVARDLTGGEEDARVKPRVSYSKVAAAGLVARVRKGLDRPAQDARLNFPELTKVSEKDGLEVEAGRLERRVKAALLSLHGGRTVEAPTRVTKAKVTRDQLASKYPKIVVVNRGGFRLSLYKNLKLQKSYPIAVGQAGLETPAGLYHIQNKAVNAAWSVPNSPWAGSLAGTVIPGGAPNNPLKARWMGIFDGAGIHGTDQVGSLGTAASHGCIRMAIPDVIQLYDQVDVQTPVYIA
ncbi:MAG: L,D-transpeptidase/peptidoglycan binding protein [Actinomycetota bacterium]|nr:L,D-transpeptidase/peptidoglycan binding protein [Actinomycetota bacterium]